MRLAHSIALQNAFEDTIGYNGELTQDGIFLPAITTILAEEDTVGQIVIVNEDLAPLAAAIDRQQACRPFIILSSLRGDPRLMNMVGDYERIGGFCQIVYEPVSPIRLHAALKMCLHIIKIGQGSRMQSTVPYAQNRLSLRHRLLRRT